MNEVNPIMVQTLAKMTGKTEEEVLKFLEKKEEGLVQHVPDLSVPQQVNAPKVDPEAIKTMVENMQGNEKLINTMPTARELSKTTESKGIVTEEEVITEEVPLEDLSQQQLKELGEQEDNIEYSGNIKVGSRVRITYHKDDGVKGKIKWVGRTGTVKRVIGNELATIYEVEFPAGKIPFQRINKKSGKLEKGYNTKKMLGLFEDSAVELVF